MSTAVLVPASYVTVAATGVALDVGRSVMFVPVIDDASIGSLNVTLTVVLSGTFVAAFAGTTLLTVGAITSAVINAQVFAAVSGLPAASRAPVVIVAVYDVPLARGAAGVNVAVVPL